MISSEKETEIVRCIVSISTTNLCCLIEHIPCSKESLLSINQIIVRSSEAGHRT